MLKKWHLSKHRVGQIPTGDVVFGSDGDLLETSVETTQELGKIQLSEVVDVELATEIIESKLGTS